MLRGRAALLPIVRRLPRIRAYSTALAAEHDEPVDIKVEAIVEAAEQRVLSLFEKHGNSDYIGEPMSITEHSVQTACAASKQGEDDTAILACLLHDVGHLAGLEAGHAPGMDGCGTPEHERVGAELLGAIGLPDDVAYLAHHHVSAKRYLCATQPDYIDKLTEASKTTLIHQGGPMSAEEVAAAEADPRWPMVLRMRTYDEAGKDPNAAFTSPRDFLPMLRTALRQSVSSKLARQSTAAYPLSEHADTYVLSSEQLRFWDEHGYLIIRGCLPPRFDGGMLSKMADEAAALPSAPCYPWLVHHERSRLDGQTRICRVENFVKHHNAWADVAVGIVQSVVSQAFRSPALLFKDKINYKGPGGGGFLPHQDATAYATDDLAQRHISVRVAIDHSDELNGPLEVPSRPGLHTRGIYPNRHGVMEKAVEEEVGPWTPVLVGPGDVVIFDSYLPHRSFVNESDRWRRSAYLTYNKASEGDFHSAYYRKKLAAFSNGSAGAISINDDFGGRPARRTPPAYLSATAACNLHSDIFSLRSSFRAGDIVKL